MSYILNVHDYEKHDHVVRSDSINKLGRIKASQF